MTQKLFSLFNTSDFQIQRSLSKLFSHLCCLKNRGLICFFTASVFKTNSFKEIMRPFDLEPEIQAGLHWNLSYNKMNEVYNSNSAGAKSFLWCVSLKDQSVKNDAINRMAAMSSAQIVSATAIHSRLGLAGLPRATLPGSTGVRDAPAHFKSISVHLKDKQKNIYPCICIFFPFLDLAGANRAAWFLTRVSI